MKVLLINSSSHENGCTYRALSEVAKSLNKEGIETEIVQLKDPINDCIGCGERIYTVSGLPFCLCGGNGVAADKAS